MIELHQFAPAYGLPNASPFCMKVEAYLRLTGLEYETRDVGNPASGPYGKAPWIVEDGQTVGDSRLILHHLKQKHGDPLGEGLSEQQRAAHHAIVRMLEESLYFTGMAERWTMPENAELQRENLFAFVPGAMRKLVFAMARRSVVRSLHGQGAGRLPADEVTRLGCEDIDALSHALADKPFFGGDKMREIDCAALSFLANFIYPPTHSPIGSHAKSKENLVAYTDRLMQEVFPDYPQAA